MDRNITPSSGKPEPGQTVEVEITGMAAGGKGVARLDGFTLLIPRALRGERVRVKITSVKARHGEGRVVEVLDPISARVHPHCLHFSQCGGCDWMHLNYLNQLDFKREVVADQLQRLGGLEPPTDFPIHPSSQENAYRDKIEFVPVQTQHGLKPGLHPLWPGPPIPVMGCLLAPPGFHSLAEALLDFLSGAESGGRPHPAADHLTRLTIQSTLGSTGQPALALTLHLSTRKAAGAIHGTRDELLGFLDARVQALEMVALLVKEKQRGGSLRPWWMLRGQPELIKEVRNFRFRVPLRGFFQVHPGQAGQLLERVLFACEGEFFPAKSPPLLFDLFCGVGLYAIPLANAGFRVVGAEKQGESIRSAQQTARSRKLEQASFYTRDLEKPGVLEELLKTHGTPSAIVVNPPRSGLPKALTESLLKSGVHRLIYISCDSGTFSRDAARLSERYLMDDLEGVDLFPMTHHLELFARFRLHQE